MRMIHYCNTHAQFGFEGHEALLVVRRESSRTCSTSQGFVRAEGGMDELEEIKIKVGSCVQAFLKWTICIQLLVGFQVQTTY